MELITRRVKAESIGLPKWVNKVLEDHGLDSKDVEVVRKGIIPEDTKFKEGERSSVDYINTKAIDRDGEIVVPSGAVLDHYRKHPVVLFAHDYSSLPIGKSLWIKSDEKGLISKTQYAKHQKADDIYQYRKDGFPMAKSIGFIPLEAIEEKDFDKADLKSLGLTLEEVKGAKRIYPKWLMLEYSDVPVPSNPEALQLAIAKGILTIEDAKKKSDAFVFEIEEPEEKALTVEVVSSTGDKVTVWSDDDISEAGDGSDEKDVLDDIALEPKTVEEEKEVILEITAEVGDEILLAQAQEADKSFFGAHKSFKAVDGINEIWNKSLGKSFDVSTVEVRPSGAYYDMAAKWLDCKVREVFVCDRFISSAMMGTYLSGLREALKNHELLAIRNFTFDWTESPPEHAVIQLNSEKSDDFLIEGMEFYEKGDEKVIIKRRANYFGISLTAYSSVKKKNECMKIFSDASAWAKDNNFLKGECFSLGGEFLKKTGDSFESTFLTSDNEKAITRTIKLINEKGKDLQNRGSILMGPPGTGKTLSGRIIRNNVNSTFIWISARDFIYSGSVGGIEYGFSLARELAPTVLFIEDIDNWLHERACDLLKTEMDGLSKSTGVVTILTSNYPEKLPPALLDRPGRFHDILNFDLPSREIRARMIKFWAGDIHQKTIDLTVTETAGFSGAHMHELISFAKTIADDEGIELEAAIVISLKKIKDQRLMIENLYSGKKPVLVDEEIEKEVEIGIIEKSGKVLSKKTRETIGTAINHMSKATIALGEFIESVDKPEAIEEVKDLTDNIVVEMAEPVNKDLSNNGNFIDIDEKGLKNAISTALTDLLRGYKGSGVDIVKERLDLAKGRVF